MIVICNMPIWTLDWSINHHTHTHPFASCCGILHIWSRMTGINIVVVLVTHRRNSQYTLPDISQYKDIHNGTKLVDVTLTLVTTYLNQFGKKRNQNKQHFNFYKEMYHIYVRSTEIAIYQIKKLEASLADDGTHLNHFFWASLIFQQCSCRHNSCFFRL